MKELEDFKEYLNRHRGMLFEDAIISYIKENIKNFPSHRIHELMISLNIILYDSIREDERIASISKERASYIKTYLEGKMFTDRKAAEENVGMQIQNAQSILDACERKGV